MGSGGDSVNAHTRTSANRNLRDRLVTHLKDIPEGQFFDLRVLVSELQKERPCMRISVKRVGTIMREYREPVSPEVTGIPVLRYHGRYNWQRIPCEVAE